MAITDSVMISSRTLFSITHAQSAAYHTRKARQTEDKYPPPASLPEEIRIDHQASVIAAVILSMAFLEALANELFLACVHGDRSELTSALTLEQRAQIVDHWETVGDKGTPLKKINCFLTQGGKQPFDSGTQPFQDTSLVIYLRNALVHAKTETVVLFSEFPDTPVTEQKFEKRLRGKFSLNPFTGKGNAFFPYKVLSAGCAQWAFSSCISVGDAVYDRLGIPPPYHHVRSRLLLS